MPVKFFDISIPSLPPSVNAVWRVGKSGRPYLAAKAAKWRENAVKEMSAKWHGKDEFGNLCFKDPYTDPVLIMVKLMKKNKREWDLDNKMKLIQDAIQAAGILGNDSQICMIVAVKVAGGMEKTEISLWKLDTLPSILFEDVVNGWCD